MRQLTKVGRRLSELPRGTQIVAPVRVALVEFPRKRLHHRLRLLRVAWRQQAWRRPRARLRTRRTCGDPCALFRRVFGLQRRASHRTYDGAAQPRSCLSACRRGRPRSLSEASARRSAASATPRPAMRAGAGAVGVAYRLFDERLQGLRLDGSELGRSRHARHRMV